MRRAAAVLAILLAAPPLAGAQPGLTLPQQGQVNVKAQRVRYDAKNRVFTAAGAVVMTLGDLRVTADAMRVELGPMIATASGSVHLTQRTLVLDSAALKADLRPQVVYASGGVTVADEGMTLTAQTLRYGLTTTDLEARGGAVLSQANLTVSGDVLIGNSKEKRGEATGGVKVVRKPGPVGAGGGDVAKVLAEEETVITAERVRASWAQGYEAQASGRVTVVQRDKNAAADTMTYSERDNRLVMEGSVRLEQLSGDWLFKTNLITAPPEDAQTRRAMAEETVVTGRRLVVLLRERDMDLTGDVKVVQKSRTAQGDHGTYTEKDRRMVLTGNVLLTQADGSRLRSDKVVISLVDQTFEAVGNVETVFTITRK